jgi:lysyl-tRNA synthetase class I
MKATNLKVFGKICPCCGQVGSVLYETEKRIVYECPDGHQYETKKMTEEKSGTTVEFIRLTSPHGLG